MRLYKSFICVALWTGGLWASTFTVSKLQDNSSEGTLRWAIEQANSNPGPDTILFNLDGTILLSSQLPPIVDDGTIIDASDQWQGDWPKGEPGIILNGKGASLNTCGLIIDGAEGCVIKGLCIKGFTKDGLQIRNNAQNNQIGGSGKGERNVIANNNGCGILTSSSSHNQILFNFIGTTTNGSEPFGNVEEGIRIEKASGNIIRGNLISGNKWAGIRLLGVGTDSNRVMGNLIGTDITAKTKVKNHQGIIITEGASKNFIGGLEAGEGNIISGNNYEGLVLSHGADSNEIIGNYIGTDSSGAIALGNDQDGITIIDVAEGNTVSNNLISGNGWYGVHLSYVNNNLVVSNYIGVDKDGIRDMGNEGSGVVIEAGSKLNLVRDNLISGNNSYGVRITGPGTEGNQVLNNIIGTDKDIENTLGNGGGGLRISGAQKDTISGNVISGNIGPGVMISFSGSLENSLFSNYIGTDSTGLKSLPNKDFGVLISKGAQSNLIGPGNIIAYNGNSGIFIEETSTLYNTISQNSIYSNDGLGIDLDPPGPTDDTSGIGPNNHLRAPVITNGVLTGSDTYDIEGEAGPNQKIELYRVDNPSSPLVEPDSLGYGEGYLFLDSTITGADSQFSFSGISLPEGSFITLTATDGEGNTSEFSRNFPKTGVLVESDQEGVTDPGVAKMYSLTITNQSFASYVVDVRCTTNLKDWTVRLYENDGTTPLRDSDGNGIKDVGIVEEDGSVNIKVEVTPPKKISISQGGLDTTEAAARTVVEGLIPWLSVSDSAVLITKAKLEPDIHNYPNPFKGETHFKYSLPEDGMVSLRIYNEAGELVRTLMNDKEPMGIHEMLWEGDNDSSKKVAPGTYIYVFRTPNKKILKKLVVLP